MKKILLGIILPILTLVTLVGTGFATWYFGESKVVGTPQDLTVTVDDFAEIGSWKVDATGKTLVLDQPTVAGKTNNVKLLTAKNGTEGTIVATYTPVTGSNNTDIKVTCTITIPSALAHYVELDSTKFGNATTTTDDVYTVDLSTTNNTITIDTASFKYKEVNVPKNKADYDKMVQALKSVANVKVTFTAEFKTTHELLPVNPVA